MGLQTEVCSLHLEALDSASVLNGRLENMGMRKVNRTSWETAPHTDKSTVFH